MQVSVRVPAKINVVLSVGPLRPDGFHELATVYHAVSLYDDVTASLPDEETAAAHVGLTVDGPYRAGVPLDGSNLAIKAVHALAAAAGVPARARLRVHKAIPVAAGLAGGSADAAAALLACDALWGLQWPTERLLRVAASLGSDVPFSLIGGTAVGTGRGELLEPLTVTGNLSWVLAIADGALSTPAVYRRLDERRAGHPAAEHAIRGPERSGTPTAPSVPPAVRAALTGADAAALAPLLRNDMQAAAIDLRPGLSDVLDAGRDAGALAGIVSGSGPTCVLLARDAAHARKVADQLVAAGPCAAAVPVIGPARPERRPAPA